jgi:hypothetical protein
MTNAKIGLTLLAVVTITLMLTLAPSFTGPILAVKTSSSSVKTPGKTTTTTSTHHIKGVRVFRIHTIPSKVAVGNTFGFRGIVFNNSTATITFGNGTCASPLSITFNKNVMTEPKATTASCKTQQVTLKPGGHSAILSPNLSGIIYRATAPGMTNATLSFKYGAVTATSKSHISDSISRVYSFSILPTGSQPTSLNHSPRSTSSSQPGVLNTVP